MMEPVAPEKVRIDKWLFSIRLFKSRTLAADACKGSKVKIGYDAVKSSYMLGVDEVVQVRKDGFTFQYRVLKLIEKRVGAPLALVCYEDVTPVEEKNKYEAWFTQGAAASVAARERGAGRPTKRERRTIEKLEEGFDG